MFVTGLAVLVAGAWAQATPVDEFVGDASETWSGSDRAACIPHALGEVCSNDMLISSSWGYACGMSPYEGGYFAGSAGGGEEATIHIDGGVRAFGGYFGTNYGDDNPVTFSFLDKAGGIIATDEGELGSCGSWSWFGWEFDERVYAVVVDNGVIRDHAHMDWLQFDTDPVAPSLALTVGGDCPGPMTLTVSGATAGAPWALLSSHAEGSAVLPAGPCTGTATDLRGVGLRFRGMFTADALGGGALAPTIPPTACGAKVQAIDLATCTMSNVGTL
jgi:hypothetical protein